VSGVQTCALPISFVLCRNCSSSLVPRRKTVSKRGKKIGQPLAIKSHCTFFQRIALYTVKGHEARPKRSLNMLTKSHKSICPQASRLWRFWQTRFEWPRSPATVSGWRTTRDTTSTRCMPPRCGMLTGRAALLGRRVLQDGTSFTITQIPLGRCDVGFVANPIHSPVAPSYNDSA